MPVLSGVSVTAPGFLDNQETWLDKRGRTRTVPMRLLCLGLNRTGTTSLRVALHELGYSTYHGWSMMENPPDCRIWDELLSEKYERGGKTGYREGFDQILFNKDALLDIPGSVFVEELMDAYPEAKVLITTRDVDNWYKSMSSTIAIYTQTYHDFIPRTLRALDKAVGIYIPTMYTCFVNKYHSALRKGADPAEGKAVYAKHLETVRARAKAQKRDYLEFDVKQGWRPLCRFLGKDVPRDENGEEKPFPRVNDAGAYHDVFNGLFMTVMLKRLGEWAVSLGAVAALAYGSWWAWNM